MRDTEHGDEDAQVGVDSGPFFWSPPLISDVRFDNNVAQARDVLAGERNFLSSLRTGIYALLAATSIIGLGSQRYSRNWTDWVLCSLLFSVGVLIPVFSLLNYAHAFDSWKRDVAAVHTTRAYIMCVLFTAVVAILIIAREYAALA